MKIEMNPLANIRPYENNPRLNDQAVDAVSESIARFGFPMELVPLYCDVIVQRWEQFTGKKAERQEVER
jgi:hypothetical protein